MPVTEPPSHPSPKTYMVRVGTQDLWAAWAVRGVLRRLFASKTGAEAEAKAYDELELDMVYFAKEEGVDDDELNTFKIMECRDLLGQKLFAVSMVHEELEEETFYERAEARRYIAELASKEPVRPR